FDSKKQSFELKATSGVLVGEKASFNDVPKAKFDVDSLLRGEALFIRHLCNDERMPAHDWVQRERMTSFAAYPLVMEAQLVGVMAIFARHQLQEQVCQEMGSVAHGISLCIERKRSEQALDASEVRYRSVVENIREVIFQLDEFGQWTFLNPAWTAMTGFEVKPTLGTFHLEYLHEEEREHNRHIFLQLIERKIEYCRYETRFLTKNG